MINNILLNDYINNSSDILSLSKDKCFTNLLNKLDKNEIINVNSKLIHKNNITYLEQFIFNLDMYISFIKKYLLLNQQEVRYIIYLTIYDNNDILFDKEYYYDNKDKYIAGFKNMFLSKYLNNYNILKKYIKINKYNFDSLINKLNQLKNKAHFYFENINKNLPYYIEIINYLENTSNMCV